MKKAIVIGASSGIGRSLTKQLSSDGYVVGITGRRLTLLEELKSELPNEIYLQSLDVTNEKAGDNLQDLIDEMGQVDLIVICAGTGSIDPELPWEKEKETIDTNVTGFTAMANTAYHYFTKRKEGHIVGISSIAALRGGDAPAYNASKAYVSNYLEGLRYIFAKSELDVTVTDVKPGFVNTAMAQGDGLFWVAEPEKAAAQICAGIHKKKKHLYVTKRWAFIAWILKHLPEFLYHKI